MTDGGELVDHLLFLCIGRQSLLLGAALGQALIALLLDAHLVQTHDLGGIGLLELWQPALEPLYLLVARPDKRRRASPPMS